VTSDVSLDVPKFDFLTFILSSQSFKAPRIMVQTFFLDEKKVTKKNQERKPARLRHSGGDIQHFSFIRVDLAVVLL
jgi:hypothetical protein